MNNQHPITPLPELVKQWCHDRNKWTDFENVLSIRAARWGADQELEACLERILDVALADQLRTARRPKPPTLKEQALEAAIRLGKKYPSYEGADIETIRRALEALPND
jgi:hypothetical protein